MQNSRWQILVGFVLLSGMVVLYNHFSDRADESRLNVLRGKVSATSIASQGGETEHNYYVISLLEFEKPFYFRSCAFLQMRSSPLDIAIGEEVLIGVTEERKGYYQSATLQTKNEVFLTIADVNSCLKAQSRIWIFVFIGLLVLLSGQMVYQVAKSRRRKTE